MSVAHVVARGRCLCVLLVLVDRASCSCVLLVLCVARVMCCSC